MKRNVTLDPSAKVKLIFLGLRSRLLAAVVGEVGVHHLWQ